MVAILSPNHTVPVKCYQFNIEFKKALGTALQVAIYHAGLSNHM